MILLSCVELRRPKSGLVRMRAVVRVADPAVFDHVNGRALAADVAALAGFHPYAYRCYDPEVRLGDAPGELVVEWTRCESA